MNHTEDELTRDLEAGAGRFEAHGGRDRTLTEVLGTARTIRRRRRAGTALVAAAVVAVVAVPVGLTVGNQSATAPPPATTTTPTPRPVQQIGLGDLPVGAAPGTGWTDGRTWHAADGSTVAIPRRVGEVRAAAVTDGGVVLSSTSGPEGGALEAWFLHEDGTLEDLGGQSGLLGLARSPEGHVVAFVGPDDRPVVLQDGKQRIELPAAGGQFPQAVAVTGEDCGAQGDCVVYLATQGDPSGSTVQDTMPSTWRSGWLTTTALSAERVGPKIETVADVDGTGRTAGIVSHFQSGTCSKVQDRTGHKLWGSCTARFVAFSPDDTRLLGTSPYGDGLGSTQLTVFEPTTGAVQLDLRTVRGVVISQMVWEDDSHVLAAVMEAGRAAVLRIGLDGRAEYAVPPVPQHDDVNPFLLPVS